MQNARLDELQSGIKVAGRNINNLRYADDATQMAPQVSFLQSFLEGEEMSSRANFLTTNAYK